MADEATILTEAQQLKLNGAKVRTMCQMAPRAHSRDPVEPSLLCLVVTSSNRSTPCPSANKHPGALMASSMQIDTRISDEAYLRSHPEIKAMVSSFTK